MTTENTNTETTELGSADDVQLQVTDLVKILEILNVVSARGAIKPDEFSVVGGVYERIYKFLVATNVIKPRTEDDETSASENIAQEE